MSEHALICIEDGSGELIQLIVGFKFLNEGVRACSEVGESLLVGRHGGEQLVFLEIRENVM